ncbi:MAG TPA: hypothetical protein VGX25_30575 [Actinophytocola sp.]|uniref:hypothetical protein n=1 Tax=Actinophytocola sp. TaxID=1872138 RepID=UPI002DDCA3A1|nr:hypothetical protein [Actinophytocola sp.]HEV2783753.1 hypothetical protein [Actinophytocola sp.]
MRRFSTFVLVAAAAITVTATTAGSAYAGEATTTRLDSPASLVTPTSTDYEDDLYGGCSSRHKGAVSSAESIKR